MIAIELLRDFEKTISASIAEAQSIVNNALKNANLTPKQEIDLKKANEMNAESMRKIKEYKQKLKDDFNI